jgi:hypothetical protein
MGRELVRALENLKQSKDLAILSTSKYPKSFPRF